MAESETQDFECFEDNSNCESLINSVIIKEEERLTLENLKATDELKTESEKENVDVKYEEELNEQKEVEAELKHRRFRKLTHLLENSKVYSMLIKETLQSELKKKKINVTQNQQSKNSKKTRSKPNLGDLEEAINHCQQIGEDKQGAIEENYFKETRVTRLGFTVSYKQPMLLEGGVLKDYQLKGLEWLKVLFSNGVNGILADEMGLGKTIQVIAFICHMIEQNIKGPFLIVAPLSTISNWLLEFQRFAPNVPIMLYHGSEEKRKKLIPEMLQVTTALNKPVHKVVITSFQIPLRDRAILGQISWYYLIVDEGHRIKNHNSQLSRTLRRFNTIGRLILTGTPLQNNLSELWSLLNFLLPEIFNNLSVFESWFDIKELESNGARFMSEKLNIDVVTILQEILAPFLLRREKKDVNLQLPSKKEVLIYCPMTPRQRDLYTSVLDRSIERLLKTKENFNSDIVSPPRKRKCFLRSPYGGKDLAQTEYEDTQREWIEENNERFVINLKMTNTGMLLRKIVHHPYLIQYPLHEGTEELRIDEDLVKESGKMMILDALLNKLKVRGHKVLIFSYFKLVLDIIEDYANLRGFKYCRLDGGMNVNDRDDQIRDFNSKSDVFIFLITVRSGGLGINLTSADTVIFYDSDWNPQVDLQSQDRCHRIGQNRPVIVYKLCVRGTIDETIVERAKAKRRLEKMILHEGKYTTDSKLSKKLTLMDLQELKALIESINHDNVISSNGSAVLTEEQLESLMDRSPKTGHTEEDNKSEICKIFTFSS